MKSLSDQPKGKTHGDDKSQADKLVELATKVGAQFFHDQFYRSHVRLLIEGHREIWPCRSKDFRNWLARQLWLKEKKAANSSALSAAINVLEAKARFEGDQYTLHNRVAFYEGDIFYDLANKHWQAVKVMDDGWEIISNPPILFRRYAHQRPQPEPIGGGNLQDLLRFVNLSDPSQQLLALVYVVSCIVPDIPHPIPVVYGPQGSAKTTFLRLLRRLIDPSATEILSFPRDFRELVQQLSHHWTPYYDNLSQLSANHSDALCRAVTGEGFSKRELYTDDEDMIYQFRCCPGLNGINVLAGKPDLLDRSVLFGLEEIPRHKRKLENELLEEFERVRPALFGAVLDALSEAMLLLPFLELPRPPRMADFAKWGCAIATTLGYSQEEFLAAFDQNMRIRNDEVLANNPVGMLVVVLMEETGEWEGQPTQLLKKLNKLAEKHGVNRKNRSWPKAAHALTHRLNEISSNLRVAGIELVTDRGSHQRSISLRKKRHYHEK